MMVTPQKQSSGRIYTSARSNEDKDNDELSEFNTKAIRADLIDYSAAKFGSISKYTASVVQTKSFTSKHESLNFSEHSKPTPS